MKILFIHNNFPGQYRRLYRYLKNDPAVDEMVVCTLETNKQEFDLPRVVYKPHREPAQGIHPTLKPLEESMINAQNAFQKLAGLRNKGWKPDIICSHSGWGPGLFLRELWPDTRMLTFFEWYYHSSSDATYLRSNPMSEDERVRLHMRNASFWADLAIMDWGISPTRFQHRQLPPIFRNHVEVLHDGIDTDYLVPDPNAKLTIGDRVFTPQDEIVTYTTRGMEPYRGFPQFMQALAQVQKKRPNLQAIIVGKDRVAYGPQRTDGKTYKQEALEQYGLDQSRLHFLDLVPFDKLRTVFQISSLHIYFTVPFVLSWSMLEAMSTGVQLLGSDTEPVKEVVEDGKNGLLVDFRNPRDIARRMEEALANRGRAEKLRRAARRTMEERYAAKHLLACHRQLILDVASGVKTCR